MGVAAVEFAPDEAPVVRIRAHSYEEIDVGGFSAFYLLKNEDGSPIALVELPIENGGPKREWVCIRNCPNRVKPM